MKSLYRNIKNFFKEDFCYPSDFINIDWKIVKINLKESFLFGAIILILYILIGLFLMLQYYITLPFRLLNEIGEWWTY